jgi:hypothetical protein
MVFPFKHGRNDRSSSIWIFLIHLIFIFLSDFGVVGWFLKGLYDVLEVFLNENGLKKKLEF